MFVPERSLRDLIISYVRRQESSISGVARQLQKDGYKLHRLYITGYLKALADLGMIREKEIPPAKVYTPAAHREKNLYEAVGERSRVLHQDPEKALLLALSTLQLLFRRPVFLREVRECGFPGGLREYEADEVLREEARQALSRVGIAIPTNEPAYVVPSPATEAADQIIADVLLDRFGSTKLVLGTRQVRLTDVARA